MSEFEFDAALANTDMDAVRELSAKTYDLLPEFFNRLTVAEASSVMLCIAAVLDRDSTWDKFVARG